MMRSTLLGVAAGAAATTALNATTYLDMAVRGRGSSSTPEQSVERLLGTVGVDVPGGGDTRQNRLSGLGAMLGIVTGAAVGGAYGMLTSLTGRPGMAKGTLLAATGAMAAGNGPMVVLGISDPRTWSAGDWVSDVLPHAAFGAVLAATFEAASSDGR